MELHLEGYAGGVTCGQAALDERNGVRMTNENVYGASGGVTVGIDRAKADGMGSGSERRGEEADDVGTRGMDLKIIDAESEGHCLPFGIRSFSANFDGITGQENGAVNGLIDDNDRREVRIGILHHEGDHGGSDQPFILDLSARLEGEGAAIRFPVLSDDS